MLSIQNFKYLISKTFCTFQKAQFTTTARPVKRQKILTSDNAHSSKLGQIIPLKNYSKKFNNRFSFRYTNWIESGQPIGLACKMNTF